MFSKIACWIGILHCSNLIEIEIEMIEISVQRWSLLYVRFIRRTLQNIFLYQKILLLFMFSPTNIKVYMTSYTNLRYFSFFYFNQFIMIQIGNNASACYTKMSLIYNFFEFQKLDQTHFCIACTRIILRKRRRI